MDVSSEAAKSEAHYRAGSSHKVASQMRCKSGRAQVPRSSIYAAAVTVSVDSVGTSSVVVGLKS